MQQDKRTEIICGSKIVGKRVEVRNFSSENSSKLMDSSDLIPAKAGAEFGDEENLEMPQAISLEEDAKSRKAARQDRETKLFNDFLAGNDEAYRVLYDAYEVPLYTYCCKLIGNDTLAQDVFQDVWIRMYKLRGERATVRKFSGLLFTVGHNYSLNAIRDGKLAYKSSIEDLPAESEYFVRTHEHEEADTREMIQKALAQLPFIQREAFILREYSGYSYKEIAEITGASMMNVKTRAWRAKERLRKVISAWMELRVKE